MKLLTCIFCCLCITSLCIALDTSFSVLEVSGPTEIKPLSELQKVLVENSKEQGYSKKMCGNEFMSNDVPMFRQQMKTSTMFEQSQSGCQITQCDIASVRDSYNVSSSYGITLEFWVEKAFADQVSINLPALVAFINSKYDSARIRFKAVQYNFTAPISGPYYVNSPCDSTWSQPCSDASSLLSSVISTSGVRSNIKTNGTLAILVTNIQEILGGGSILGYAFFPWSSDFGMMVLSPSAAKAGDITAPHEIGHFLGLYHTFHGIDEVPPCSSCYEFIASDTVGDLCADTPPFPNTVGVNTCVAPSTSVIQDPCVAARSSRGAIWPAAGMQNIMSFVGDACANVFTENQQSRMRCYAVQYAEAQIVQDPPLVPPTISLPPIITSSSSSTTINALSVFLVFLLVAFVW